MNSLFGQTPIIMQWFPSISEETVVFLNRIGQVIVLVSGALAFYEAKVYWLIRRQLYHVAGLNKYVWVVVARNNFSVGIGNQPPEPAGSSKELPFTILLLLTLAILHLIFVVSSRGPSYWLIYPFMQFWHAFTVWGSIRLTLLSILVTPIKSVFLLVWFLLSFMLVSMAFTVVIKTCLVIARWGVSNFSRPLYKSLLFVLFVFGSFLVIITT